MFFCLLVLLKLIEHGIFPLQAPAEGVCSDFLGENSLLSIDCMAEVENDRNML